MLLTGVGLLTITLGLSFFNQNKFFFESIRREKSLLNSAWRAFGARPLWAATGIAKTIFTVAASTATDAREKCIADTLKYFQEFLQLVVG